MTLRFAEDAVNAVIAYMQANFAAKVAAINAEYTDAIDITAPTNGNYSQFDQIAPPGFPCVSVVAEGGDTPNGLRGEMVVRHRLRIVITDRDTASEADLTVRMLRYTRAVVEMLKEGIGTIGNTAAFGNKAYIVEFGTPLYQLPDLIRVEDAATIQRSVVRAVLHRQETL